MNSNVQISINFPETRRFIVDANLNDFHPSRMNSILLLVCTIVTNFGKFLIISEAFYQNAMIIHLNVPTIKFKSFSKYLHRFHNITIAFSPTI